MSSLHLLAIVLSHLINITISQINTTITITTPSPSTTPTAYFTTEPGCSSNFAFVYIKSSLDTLSDTILSERVNYPPYGYDTTIKNTKIVLYANNLNITTTQNNPCNISTWTTPTTYYDNTIVLITYNHIYDTLCTPQQWTLNLQTYNANIKAVLIAHNIVQPLSGDTKLNHPIIPTRIISKDSSNKIINIITNTTENITASIDCFNDTTHPPIICFIYSGNDWMQGNELTTHSNLVNGADTTVISRFDGEFQEQSGIIINDHPVWKKDEHDGLIVWSDYYIWLTVNHSASNDQNPWRWVIGRNYLNDQTIEAECILNTTNYIDDPTLCGNNWYRNDINGTIRQYNLTSHAGICNLGDMFLCVDTTGPNASTVSGRYRQFHKNSDYWIHESRLAYLMLWPNVFGWGLWNWVFAEGIYIDFVAICPLFNAPSANEPLPMDIILRPQDCGPQWYIVVPNISPPQAVSTLHFDADICTHANVTEAPIYYPPILCMRDIINPDSSLYQTYHGIYLLDNTSIYDGKYVYKNQRLNGSNSWYLLWVDEFDRWVINEQIPPVDIPSNIYGRTDRCMSHLDTPDTCDDCWWFYDSFWTEYQCNISVIPINSYIESDCIGDIAINNIINYTQEILICFDDGNQNIYANPITGYWILTNNTFNDRPVWTIIYSYIDDDINTIVEISYFMYYSKRWKYWVINRNIIQDYINPSFYLICLNWKEYEPFNCTNWFYKQNNNQPGQVTMDITCTLEPTFQPTINPTIQPTINPTLSPTYNCPARNIWIYLRSSMNNMTPRTAISTYVNFAPYYYSELLDEHLVIFEFKNYRNMQINNSNPCNISTWNQSPEYYNNKIVMFEYNSMVESWCSIQQWTLNLQIYANIIAVFIANDKDAGYVYELKGDNTLPDPTVPTRMISQYDGWDITDVELSESDALLDEVIVKMGCFGDNDFPAMICLIDESLNGFHIHLDGDYQELAMVSKHDHPIWRKTGKPGLWKDIYMFLDVNESAIGDNAWRWVIGTDYNDDNSIIATCNINGTHIEHPALCGMNWFVNGTLEANLTTTNDTCKLTDNYVCITSSSVAVNITSGKALNTGLTGKYRQTHEGLPFWLAEQGYFFDAYLTVGRIPFIVNNIMGPWSFIIVHNQTILLAFCIIDDGSEFPPLSVALEPYLCVNWITFDFGTFSWYTDRWFDVDICDENGNELISNITYDKYLCFIDPYFNDGLYSHYQGLFGIYILDNNVTFDGRPIYKQQRLLNNDRQWYILYYDERDSWVINDYIPSSLKYGLIDLGGVVYNYESICDEDILKPNNCSTYWEFYNSFADIIGNESDALLYMQLTNNENECVKPITNTISEHTQSIALCFDDGNTVFYQHILTGEYILGNTLINDRHFWYKNNSLGVYYLYYDSHKRFWVIDNETLGDPAPFAYPDFEGYCLLWNEFEPFNCRTWYYYSLPLDIEYTFTMYHTDCILPTSSPTNIPTISPIEIITTDSKDNDNLKSNPIDSTLMTWIIIGGILLCCCILCIFGYYTRKSDNGIKKLNRDELEGARAVSGSFQEMNWDKKISLDEVQLETLNTTAGFGAGETIITPRHNENDPLDSDNDDDNEQGIDGLNDNETGIENNIKTKKEPDNWVTFEEENVVRIKDEDGNIVNPFDDDDNIRKGRLSTIGGGSDDDNPFLKSYDPKNDNQIIIANSVEKRNNWVAFDE